MNNKVQQLIHNSCKLKNSKTVTRYKNKLLENYRKLIILF